MPIKRVRTGALALVLLALATTQLACGEAEQRALCPAYENFLDARAFVQEIDPQDETAVEATAVVEVYLSRVVKLQASADGRYGVELDALRSAVNDVLRTLNSLPDDADYATWAPLVEESLDDAFVAANRVERVIEPSCPSGTE